MATRFIRFAKSESGVAATEFSIVLAPLLLLSLGAFELQRYLRFERQLSLAAETIAAMMAQRQEGNGEAPREDLDALQHLVPNVPNWRVTIAVQMTNVVFKPTDNACKSNCDYTADVAWIWPTWTSMGTLRRTCGTLTKAEGNSSLSGKTLSAHVFGPGNVIVVDLITTYQPLLGSSLVRPVTIARQGVANARFASPYLKVDQYSHMRKCSGYP